MNRAEKIQKLSHAVREWRGVFELSTKTCRRPAKQTAAAKVRKCLERLNRPDVSADMETIAGFKHYDQFYAWLSKIQL